MIEHYPPGFRWRRGRNWFFLGLLYAGFYLCRYNLSTVTPEIAKEYGFNNAQTGMMSTGRDFGYMIGTFINGLFADALGGKLSMAIGAIGTIILNLGFGFFSGWKLDAAVLLTGFVVIRTIDGYAQGFGSPGMVKINTAWFKRSERGTFAGIFGAMIQMGQTGVIWLSKALLTGAPLIIFGLTFYTFPKLDWRSMFFVPPAVLAVLLLLMWITVKNSPKEAGYPALRTCGNCGYSLAGHADTGTCPECGTSFDFLPKTVAQDEGKLALSEIFIRIAGNPLVWVNALAYMCTGFVRRAYDFWWAKYLDNAWGIGKSTSMYEWLGYLLPAAAVVGSFGAGFISDKLFNSRRSPVAALLYSIESAVLLLGTLALMTPGIASPMVAAIFLVLISVTCNSSHSIIGTAAVMDIGGPRMAGFALGVVNSFQYLGAMMAGWVLGWVVDTYGWNAMFACLLPFSLLGTVLMTSLWWRTRGRDVRGA